ncbi:hypothetical protein [Streptomyces sp. CB03238]|uniref:hypothetical protein n=1 Tax=Streptomyces sp. CB03238 TaxID=1907777 RepID=UPI000A103DFC|nr:hypothetical protein [Streptomyces sp. CB03238]ORT54197.1 hypothetical protein BKD26_35995 [Streptomyces sp. CB03238]
MTTVWQRARLRTAGRIAPVLGILLMLFAPLAGTAQAAPAQYVAKAPAAPSPNPSEDPCELLKDTPGYEICKKEDKPKDETKCEDIDGPAGEFCKDGSSPGGNGPSDPLDSITGDCKAAPELDSPGDGVAGWFDEGPAKAPAPRAPTAANADAYLYEQYGYAGLSWHTYDLGCGGSLRAPEAATDNWLANMVFGFSKGWTALTVVLRQQATGDNDFMDDLDPVIETATRAVRDAVYSPWIGTSLLILGTVIIFQARKKDTASVLSQAGWALIVMTLATGVASYPVQASKFADDSMNTVISAIDQSFANVDLAKPKEEPKAAPEGGVTTMQLAAAPAADQTTAHGNMLVKSVLYQQWLRGMLGDTDSEVAKKYGPQLLDAQALTWHEDRLPPAERQKVVASKQQKFQELAEKIKTEDPSAYSHLTGKAGSRLGAAGLSLPAAAAANTFSMASDIVIIGAKLTIRFVVVLFPAIAVIGLHRRLDGTVKTGLNSVMAACINVPLFATAGAVDVLAVETLMVNSTLPKWVAILLLLLITWILWRIAKPFRRMSAMVNPNRNWVEDAGSVATTPAKLAKAYGKHYLVTRYMRKLMGKNTQAIEDVGDAVREQQDDDFTLREDRSSGSGYDADHGSWDGWMNPDDPNSPNSGPTRGRGQGGADDTPTLYTDYEADSGLEPHSFPAGHDPRYRPAGAIPGSSSSAADTDDYIDADAWYVEDLDPAARDSYKALPTGSGTSTGGHVGDAGSLSAPSTPDAPGPLPGGSGGGATASVPPPRSRPQAPPADTAQPPLPAADDTTTGAPATAPAADRPYVQPEAGPAVVPPTIDEDGNHVYVIFDPSREDFTIRDDLHGADAPEEGER